MTSSLERQIISPDRDGQPIADNTEQFRWIVFIKENLEIWFANRPQVFVAGDLLWYSTEAEQESQRAERLAAQLRALGVDLEA